MIRRSVIISIILAGAPLAFAPLHAAEDETPSESKAAVPCREPEPALGEVGVRGRFLQTTSTSAMKLNTPVLDTPFSVSAYSESFLKSLEAQSLQDTYNYM